MYAVSENGPMGATIAFKKVEDAINWKLKGRKFYGIMQNGEYKACVNKVESDNAKELGLLELMIPGGKYAKAKITDWERHIEEIGSVFETLKKKYSIDPSRPEIEFYRSQKELFIFVPIQ
jgi:hypothetical protein